MTDKFRSHVYVLPEDDANRQIARGFVLHPVLSLSQNHIKVLPPAGGWTKVRDAFKDVHAQEMRRYPERRMVLLIDCDEQTDRLDDVRNGIPEDLRDRVFVLGVLSNPERLRKRIGKSYEQIGEALCEDCVANTGKVRAHDLLEHNEDEMNCMVSSLKPFLCVGDFSES